MCKLNRGIKAFVSDLPGTYSLNASSIDESVVIEVLTNRNDKDYPDVAVVVCDVENLKRNLLIFTQIKDLNIPSILVINMTDRMGLKGISLDVKALEAKLQTKVVLMSARKKEGLNELKEAISNYKQLSTDACIDLANIDSSYFGSLQKVFPHHALYKLSLIHI